jgi:predicted unusual protein kinase regulating ubiquinone biosynthesis (AarF/ABC1/UbiB family)
MTISTVRLYHPALWKILWSYRAVLVTLRTIENVVRTNIYMLGVGPFVVAWTRLPGTRHRQPPIWKSLASVVAPLQQRASLTVGAGQMGSSFAAAGTIEEISLIQSAVVGSRKRPSRAVSVLGAYLRGMFAYQGPAFIKMGQLLSMREEVPYAVRDELAFLQDKLPPMPYKTVKKILERELDRPVEEVFEWVEETAIASASLAQVHRAKLRKEQAEVALKIQRRHLPGTVVLDTIFLCDIVIGIQMFFFRTLAKGADAGCFTTSYRESLTKEIDFVLEERSQSRYRGLVMNHPVYSQGTKIAKTYREYTTTKLLTMEFVKNYHRMDRILDDLTPQQLMEFATAKVDGWHPEIPLQLVGIQIALQLEAMCHWGIAHGDLHLGNLYVLEPDEECDRWRIFLCDFGMMLEGGEGFRTVCIEAGIGLMYAWDGELFAKCLLVQSTKPVSEKNTGKLMAAIAGSVNKYCVEVVDGKEKMFFTHIQRGGKGNVLSEIIYETATLGLSMAPDLWLFLKNFGYLVNTQAALWTSLNPTHMFAMHAKKFLKDVMLCDLEAKNITNMRESMPEMVAMFREYDRKQILKALDGDGIVTPMPQLWAHDWDIREELALREPKHV